MKVLTQLELHNVSGGRSGRGGRGGGGRLGGYIGLFNAAYDAYTGFRDGWRSV
jgi:hypothetical protein